MNSTLETLNRFDIYFHVVIGIVIGCLITTIAFFVVVDFVPLVDLPEEYKSISPNTPIRGKYDPNTDTLSIWFYHEK